METARTLISIYCSRTAHLSYLSLSVALVACSLLCPPNQMKERRDASKREEKDEKERERECGSVFFFLFFCRVCFALPLPPFLHFVPRLAELLPQLSLPPSSCLDRSLVNNSMTTRRQRTGRNFYWQEKEYLCSVVVVFLFPTARMHCTWEFSSVGRINYFRYLSVLFYYLMSMSNRRVNTPTTTQY